jgi:general nucleoside transport system permease protein
VPEATTLSKVTDRGQRVIQSPVTASLVIAFLVVALIITVTGSNPFEAYLEIWRGAATGSGPRTTINRAIPIVGMAIALSLPFRAGIVSLGGEGQLVLGGLAASLVAIYLPGPGPVVIAAAMLAGAGAGTAWAALPALGQAHLQLPILITSLLLNAPARALSSYIVKYYFSDPTATSTTTVAIPASTHIPTSPLVYGASLSALLILALVIMVSARNSRTVSGYEGFISGVNLRFSRYGGVEVRRQTIVTMLASGAIAGAVGAHLVLGQAFRFVDGDLARTGFAWTGLLVALLAAHRAWPILTAGLFFAALQVGGLAMQRTAGVSWQLAQVLQAIVILALVMRIVLLPQRIAPPDDLAETAPEDN